MIDIRLYHSKAFKKEGGYFIFSCHNNDDLEEITVWSGLYLSNAKICSLF